jgi:hypothetical protein
LKVGQIRARDKLCFYLRLDCDSVLCGHISDALEADLQSLATSGLISQLSKYDTVAYHDRLTLTKHSQTVRRNRRRGRPPLILYTSGTTVCDGYLFITDRAART